MQCTCMCVCVLFWVLFWVLLFVCVLFLVCNFLSFWIVIEKVCTRTADHQSLSIKYNADCNLSKHEKGRGIIHHAWRFWQHCAPAHHCLLFHVHDVSEERAFHNFRFFNTQHQTNNDKRSRTSFARTASTW